MGSGIGKHQVSVATGHWSCHRSKAIHVAPEPLSALEIDRVLRSYTTDVYQWYTYLTVGKPKSCNIARIVFQLAMNVVRICVEDGDCIAGIFRLEQRKGGLYKKIMVGFIVDNAIQYQGMGVDDVLESVAATTYFKTRFTQTGNVIHDWEGLLWLASVEDMCNKGQSILASIHHDIGIMRIGVNFALKRCNLTLHRGRCHRVLEEYHDGSKSLKRHHFHRNDYTWFYFYRSPPWILFRALESYTLWY